MGGAERGPQALLLRGLERRIDALGFRREQNQYAFVKPGRFPNHPQLHWIPELIPALRTIHEEVLRIRRRGSIPITLGGDHSVAIATASAAKRAANENGKKIALIWVDAHSDHYFDSRYRNVPHAVAMSQLLGRGTERLNEVTEGFTPFQPRDTIFVGLRDELVATDEKLSKLESEGFLILTSDRIASQQLVETFSAIEDRLKDYDEVHLSFDIDVVSEPGIRGFDFRLPGGLSAQDTLFLLDYLSKTGKVTSMDFVEFVPMRDSNGKTAEFVNDAILLMLEGMPRLSSP